MAHFTLLACKARAPQTRTLALSPRERLSLNEGWRFFKYASPGQADALICDVRPEVADAQDERAADAKPTEAVSVAATSTTRRGRRCNSRMTGPSRAPSLAVPTPTWEAGWDDCRALASRGTARWCPGPTISWRSGLDNPAHSSRWYPGGGLYRNAWLTKTQPPVHVAQWALALAIVRGLAGKPGALVLRAESASLRAAAVSLHGD